MKQGASSARPDPREVPAYGLAEAAYYLGIPVATLGRITDFAYALSVSQNEHKEWGLPKVPDHPGHVTQNPPIPSPPDDPWTPNLLEVCQRVDAWRVRAKRKKKH